MRFGAFVPQGWRLDLVGIETTDQWPTMLSVAQKIEALGFESAWVYDHFHTVPVPTQEVTYEAWTLMAALAASTSTVRLGQMCTCNGYRQPTHLAKVAASIDAISGGRIEMGIGAGWYEHEYIGYGYEFPKASVRIGQLGEAVEIMKRMWTEDVVSFEGKYYHLDGAICRPRPVQEPTIPVWVAGGGEKLTLRVAARHADYTNFGGDRDMFTHKSNVLAGHCADVGRDFDEITRSANFNVLIGESEKHIADEEKRLCDRVAPFVDPDKVLSTWFSGPAALRGTPEQIVERLSSMQELGMTYAILKFPNAAYTSEALELFADQVMPALT